MPVYQVDGKPLAIPLKPSEVRNEVLSDLRGIVTAIGLGPGSVEKLRDLQDTLQRWAAKSTAQPPARHGVSVMPTVRTVGAPQKLRLEAGPVKARHNGRRSKGPVTCSNCKEVGHTKTTCNKRGNQDTQTGRDFACDQCGRAFTNAQARSTRVTLTHTRKRSKVTTAGDDAGLGAVA